MQQQLDHVDEDKARDLIRDAIESLSEAFALYDEDNRLVLYNRRFTDMCGTVSSLLEPGLNWEILLREFTRRGIHLHAAGRQEAWVSSHFFDRLDYVQDLEMEHPDGSSFMVSLHPTKMGGFAVTGTDNTLKKQAEAVERDSELLVRTVLESSPANVVMARMGDGSIVYRSEAAKTLFGDTESARDFYLSPEDRADYIISMLPDGAVDDYRVVMINAKGKPFPASVSGRIAEFKGEDVVVSTTVDLTVQVEATALIRQVLEACPVPIQMTEAETGRLLFASPETTALFGSVENAGSYYVDPDARLRYISELRGRGWVKNYKVELKNAAGNKFWGSVSARLIDFQGQPVVVSNTTDLTDDLAIQEQLEKQRERLFQNEKMSALGELLAGVAHELNNPLTVVVGHSMMLLEDVEEPETHKRVEKISKAAERCAKIVKTFLAMARQQPGKMETTDINAVIKTAVDVAGYGHAAEGMDISCRLDESVPSIIADGDQITQVIINLVINAEQAMSKSGIGDRIEVSTRSNPAANTVEIRIKDNGPGVPDAIRGRIFEPFFTTKDVGDGTGIGLAFCHRIILSHGGHIWLDHNYRKGSRFCIRLPVSSRTHQAADEESTQQAERNLQILVLDDEADVAELISIILQKEGFGVDIANRGEDALEMLRDGTYDIVLSDLNMPGMDGRAVFETIRKDFPHMLDRLGFITGDTMGAASQSLLEESGRPHLEKPVSPADLRQLIGRLLGENGGEQQMENSDIRILVCDDERDVCELLQEYLQKRGFMVSTASNGKDLREVLGQAKVDLIVLDINMPGEDGLSILRSLRPDNATPIIMLTAAGEVVDRIIGLEMGADDYLGKPVDLRELEARIKAVLRRKAEPEKVESGEKTRSARFGEYQLDIEAAKLLSSDGSEVPLTAMEFSLLKVFAENRGRALTRDQILEQAHDRSWDPFDRSIDIRISRIRRKVEANPEKPRIIKTVRGIGYIYDPDGG